MEEEIMRIINQHENIDRVKFDSYEPYHNKLWVRIYTGLTDDELLPLLKQIAGKILIEISSVVTIDVNLQYNTIIVGFNEEVGL